MYVQVNDLKMYYEVHGNGYPLILIHGGAGTIKISWEKMLPILSKKFQVFALESRGCGKTDNPKGIMNYQIMSDDVEAFIHALGIEKPFICGWSDGGQIALEIGIKNPDLAKSLVVGGVLSELSKHNLDMFKLFGIDESGGINFEHISTNMPKYVERLIENHSEVYGSEYWKELLKNLAKMWTDPSNYPKKRISQIKIPTLVISGDRDQFIAIEQTLEIFRLIQNADLSIIPNCDHSLTQTHPKIFANIALDFFVRNNL